MQKETLIAELKSAVQVALLKEKDMHAVAADKNKNLYAYGFVVVSAVIIGLKVMGLFGGFFLLSWGLVLSTVIYRIISFVIGIYILSIVAKSIFKGQAQHDAFFRVMAFGMIVTWLSILPLSTGILSAVSGIWGLAIVFVALKTIHKLTTGGAIGSLLVTIIPMIIINMILMGMLGMGSIGYGGINFKGGSYDAVNSGNFKINVNTEEGQGSVNFEDGKATFTGPNGERMDVTLPPNNQ